MAHAETEHVYRGNLDKLLRKVREERGLDLALYRRHYVERRVAARLRALGLHSYRQYASHLDRYPDEYARLLDVLTINVTDFFRDPPVFDAFKEQVVPELLRSKLRGSQRMLRVWSAGCATGEEAYSLAMLLLDELGHERGRVLLNVFGTDIDPEAVRTAKRATYSIEKLPSIPVEYRSRYTRLQGETFSISNEVISRVRFRALDLFEDKPITVSDVIFCRNVFIYFDRAQQERVLERFWSSLSRGGFLVLGRSEKLAPVAASRFELVNGRERIYRKPGRV